MNGLTKSTTNGVDSCYAASSIQEEANTGLFRLSSILVRLHVEPPDLRTETVAQFCEVLTIELPQRRQDLPTIRHWRIVSWALRRDPDLHSAAG